MFLNLGPMWGRKLESLLQPFSGTVALAMKERLQLHNTGLRGCRIINLNQGDPSLSPDGRDHQSGRRHPWQDEGVILERADGTLHAV